MKSDSYSRGPEWVEIDNSDKLSDRISIVVITAAGLIGVVWILQMYFKSMRRDGRKQRSKLDTTARAMTDHTYDHSSDVVEKHSNPSHVKMNTSPTNDWEKNHAIVPAMLNSLLVEGLTFGYSGIVLILRKKVFLQTTVLVRSCKDD